MEDTYKIKYGCSNCGAIKEESFEKGFIAPPKLEYFSATCANCKCTNAPKDIGNGTEFIKLCGFNDTERPTKNSDGSDFAFAAGVGGFLGGLFGGGLG